MTQRIKRSSGVLAVLFFLLVFLQSAAYAADSPALLREVRDLISDNYYKSFDRKILKYNSVEAMVEGLGDPYSEYFSPEEYKAFQDDTSGTYAGIGMQMTIEQFGDGLYPVVTMTFEDSPARKAGILPGDRILAVNGEDMIDKDLDYVGGLVRGKAGTKVSLTIGREGLEPFVVHLTREIIKIEMVASVMLEDNLGYINVSQFSEDSADLVRKAVKSLKNQGAKGIIIDLRYNPGGFVSAGLDMVEIFVPNGKPIIHYRNREVTETEYSDGFPIKIPLVVLVNGDSASASELFSAAIKDYGAGTLVGTNTYGKGTMQAVVELKNAPNAALKLTIAEFLSPKGKQINGKGVAPDVYVEGDEQQLETAKSVLLKKIRQPGAAGDVLTIYPGKGESYVGGTKVANSGTPYLSNSAVMVPLRQLSIFLGGTMTWNDSNNQAVLTYGDSQAVITVGSDYAVVDGNRVKLTAPVKVVDGRVCVPLRLLSSFNGITVSWDPALKCAQVKKK